MNTSSPDLLGLSRPMLEKYLPWFVALAVIWVLGRGLRSLFWTAFGLFWAFHWLR